MMNARQQQLVAQFQQGLQQPAQQFQQLLQSAAAGCQQLRAQSPTDFTPMSNALGALDRQVDDLRRGADDAFSATFDQVTEIGEGEPAHFEMKRSLRQLERYLEETWARFKLDQFIAHAQGMWPAAQAAMQKPAGCAHCGGPLSRTTPHKSENIACPACRSNNQVMPEAVVATYFAMVPHYYAEAAAFDKRLVADRYKSQWEEQCEAEIAADRDRPDEPLDSLKKREAMERDYWTTYARTRVHYEGGSPADVSSLVESRMKFFYDEMNLNDVWRQAHGMASVVATVSVPEHLANVDEWGPLRHDQLEDNFVHETLLGEAMREPDRHAQLLRKLGYRDAVHRAMVANTYNRHYGDWLATPDGQALVSRAAMRAMQERSINAVHAGAASGLLDPVEGVSLQLYGSLQAKQPNMDPAAFQQLLAQHQLDQPKWERVQKGWIDKMSRDTTGAIATEYSKAFMGAGEGQFGAAGQAAAGTVGQGAMAQQGAGGAAPVPFEKYAEISGAMAAWSRQGKDISAMLHKHFSMTAQDFSNISMYWSTHMMQDLSSFDRMSQLTEKYEQRYLAMP